MQMTRRRTVLPFLLALAVLALVATGLMYQLTPVAAQSGGSLTAPTVTATAATACNTENPRTFLVLSYTRVDGASSYQFRVKWGRDGNLGKWNDVPNHWNPGQTLTPNNGRFLNPGETYVVQIRAVGSDETKGPHGEARYTHGGGSHAVPTAVAVAYKQNGDNWDYTKARLTWQGSSESGGWFVVQQRAIGNNKWESSGWKLFSKLDGDASPYFHDVSDLDTQKGYRFRVLSHTPSCQPSAWSEVATLLTIPDPPEFLTSVGKADGNGHMMGVWVEGPYDGTDYHKFRLGDGDAVQVTLPTAQQHRFPVTKGQSYNVCVSAGNARGESDFACRSVAAQVSSPIVSLQVVPDPQITGGLDVYWNLIPVVNPTWYDNDEGSTHAPPTYLTALRQVGQEWPTETIEVKSLAADGQTVVTTTVEQRVFRDVYRPGRSVGMGFNDLKGNTEYEVMVCSGYYGEADPVAEQYDCKTATGRTLMNPVRDLTVGFSAEPGQAIINWKAPEDASQADYVVTLRKTFGNRRVGREQPGAAAVSTTFDGLKAGHWYHVDVKAVGNNDVRSASRRCYFQQGTAGSQNTVGADENTGRRTRNSCAAAQ